MDSRDNGSVTLSDISPEKRHYELCLDAISKSVNALEYLAKPEDRVGLTLPEYNTLCLQSVLLHGSKALTYIAPEMWSIRLFKIALNKDVDVLNLLAKHYNQSALTPAQCIDIFSMAIDKYGITKVFPHLPLELQTYELCLEAVTKDIKSLEYLTKPEELRALKLNDFNQLCLKAFDIYGFKIFNHVQPQMWNFDLLQVVIEKGVEAFSYINANRDNLTKGEYFALCKTIKDKYNIKDTFKYLPPEMKTYDICFCAVDNDVPVLNYLKTAEDRKSLNSKEFAELCLKAVRKQYGEIIDPSLSEDVLLGFLTRYDSINIFKNFKMEAISDFIINNRFVLSNIYQLLGNYAYLLMEKMLITSGDNITRFLDELKNLSWPTLASCSKNIVRLFDGIDFKNAGKKAGQLKHYLTLSDEERKFIDVLLDDYKIDIDTITNTMYELTIKKFYDYLDLTYNKEKDVMHTINYDQLVDLNSLFEALKKQPDNNKSKMFFSMLKIYLQNIPFQNLHQPDEMRKKMDEHKVDEYMVQIAEHNRKLRSELEKGGIDVKQAFAYKKQIRLTFDEHQRQKILDILTTIYKKIKQSISDKNPDAINKNIKNLISQIEKGKQQTNEESKLLKILSESNLILLKRIAESELSDISTEYSELSKLAVKSEVLKNYKPRNFHIEMWDKSKIETLFLGDYLSCCLATTGEYRSEFAARICDDAFLMPVIIDEKTKKPVCAAWLFFGKSAIPPSNEQKIILVANFFEINAGIAENKELMNFLIVNLLNYIGQFSESINAAEFLMRPLTYGMIPDFKALGEFTDTIKANIEKVGGYLGNVPYYLNAVINPEVDVVKTRNFYQFDQTKFSEQMQKLIRSKSTTSEYASSMTLGFISQQKSTSGIEDNLAKEPSPYHTIQDYTNNS